MKAKGQVQKLYTERASIYDRLFVDFLGWGKELKTFFRKTDYLYPNSKVLDAGCGTGIITRVLYELAGDKHYEGIQFHAFDLTQNMLDVFQHWVEGHQADNIELHQADVLELETLPSGWNEYNLIVSSTMIEYLPKEQVKDALANLRLLLRSGGFLLIFVTRRNMITRWLAGKWWQTNVYEEREILNQLEELGFARIESKKLSPGWSSYIMVIESST